MLCGAAARGGAQGAHPADSLGQGDRYNAGFSRTAGEDAASVLALIFVSDEDDCSWEDKSLFDQPTVTNATCALPRYEDRLPIGDPEIIRTAEPETVRRFYRDWYRPGLMAVVAVGDFDLDRWEAMIREHFAHLEEPEGAPERARFTVPLHEENLYVVATDPELTTTQLQVTYKRPAETLATVGDFRERLVSRLFNTMLNDRFAEIAREPDAPFMGAGVSDGGIVRSLAAATVGAAVQDDRVLTGLEAVLTEAERVRQHGFTATELERQKREILRSYQRQFDERANIRSAALAGEYVSLFLQDEASPGVEYEYELVQRLLPEITLEQVNRRAERLLDEQGRVVIVQMPEKEGLEPPTEAELAAVFDRVEERAVAAYVDDVSEDPLVDAVPSPAAVVDRREIEEVGVTEIALENGVRVVMKPTDFKEDEVRFAASSPGGTSLVDADDLFEAQIAAQVVQQSGLGAFDRTELQKRLAGKVVSVSPFIGGLEEGLRGQASPEDLETLFQLIHLHFVAPRIESEQLAVFQNRLRAVIGNLSANPNAVFSDSVQRALYGDHPRVFSPTVEMVEALEHETIRDIYLDRFADAGDFTFVFVGSFEVERLVELARTYLGTLPATGRDETWADVGPEERPGEIETVVRKGLGERSTVLMMHHGEFEHTRENRQMLRSLADVLGIMLREELREERGGVYGVRVSPSFTDYPDDEFTLTINFVTDPQRVEELMAAVEEQVERLRREGPDPEDVQTVREQQRRARETALETNAFWLGTLQWYYDQPDEDLLDVLRHQEMIERVTPDAIREAARRYLDGDDLLRAVLYPEEAAESPAGGGYR